MNKAWNLVWKCTIPPKRNWFVRNELMHDKAAQPIEVSKRFIVSYVDTLFQIRQNPSVDLVKGRCVVNSANGSLRSHASPKPLLRWERPPVGWMKLNIDGSFDSSAEKGGVGAILWDSAGKASLFPAIQWTLLPIVVETDCLTILHLLDSKEKDRSMFASIIQEAKALVAGGNREIVIRKVIVLRGIDVVVAIITKSKFTKLQI
uniref:RNase H type-1 domain-containing protein n=2 Tax=Oryza sativa subsp. japonica TaxID=39947 RepID=Q10JV1_ORYSJ|nr:hypothetical protein [Oryza sativa Japonica Group]ABF96525.1 hypothetical protein LOC_Os03g29330 [Oryza sativa Japonica Group]